jgi:hypothetical protein
VPMRLAGSTPRLTPGPIRSGTPRAFDRIPRRRRSTGSADQNRSREPSQPRPTARRGDAAD